MCGYSSTFPIHGIRKQNRNLTKAIIRLLGNYLTKKKCGDVYECVCFSDVRGIIIKGVGFCFPSTIYIQKL